MIDTPDRPDMTVFTGPRSMAGYRLNKLSASLVDPTNRQAFLADEDDYCDRFGLTAEERSLVAERDWSGMVGRRGQHLRLPQDRGHDRIEPARGRGIDAGRDARGVPGHETGA